jgi:tRNA(Ile)-lysidine synthetase-like protein
VADVRDGVLLEHLPDERRVGDAAVHNDQAPHRPLRHLFQELHVPPLDGRVVVVVKVVEDDHRVSPAQQSLGRVASDESGAAGDENSFLSRIGLDHRRESLPLLLPGGLHAHDPLHHLGVRARSGRG